MVASLLYYCKSTDSLRTKGFISNPYNPCVWNKEVHGKILTIYFLLVDDCNLLHVSSEALEELVAWLLKDYESIFFEDGSGKIKVHWGKVHKFLGMTLNFSTKSQVSILMFKYIKDIVVCSVNSDGFKFTRITKKPALEELFKVNKDLPKLPLDMAATFHNIVAKALYASKQAYPGISTMIAFLTTQV